MSKKPNAQEFLAAMQGQQDQEDPAQPGTAPTTPPAAAKTGEVRELPRRTRQAGPKGAKAKPSRAQLKHFGGYLDDDTLEKIALLRVRLKKDNSELIKFAIDELHSRHNAKRAFGDA